ncbi:MAG: DUF3144 domain-containing protein [Variovorax sp.]
MPNKTDDGFYERADAHINLSNDQLAAADDRGKVSASMLYGTTRFNVWVTACGVDSAEQLAASRQKTLDYFCDQYRLMLEENLDDYIANFSRYMRPKDVH